MQPSFPPPPGPPQYPPEVYGVPPQGMPYPFSPPQPYGYPVPYFPAPPSPSRPPRVWTVFVAFIVAFLAGAVAPMFVIGVLVIALRGDEVTAAQPDEVERLFQSAFMAPGIFLPAIASTQVALIGVTLAA